MTTTVVHSSLPRFGLIIVGDEILSGKRADKHMPKVIELLAARGLSLSWVRYVGDDRPQITADTVQEPTTAVPRVGRGARRQHHGVWQAGHRQGQHGRNE